MGIPQIIFILLSNIGLYISFRDNGKIKKEDSISSLIGSVILYFLLWWGGFFG